MSPADGVEPRPALPVYVTPEQLAQALSVSVKTVLRWAAEDPSMPVTRLGGRVVRFEQGAITRWLARKQARIAQRSAQGVVAST